MMKSKTKAGMALGATAVTALMLVSCSGNGGNAGDDGVVTLSFAQWWQPEAGGTLEELIEEFEAVNDDIVIELQTQPYGNTKDQLVAGAASGTLPDLIGLDGNWVYDLTSQGVLADLDDLESSAGTSLVSNIEGVTIDGTTRMLNVVYASYVLFANTDILEAAGVEFPTTWSEFEEAAQAIAAHDSSISATALPLSLESPVGIKNDVLSWLWASGGTMRDGDSTNLENSDVEAVMEMFARMNSDGLIAPGIATMQEQDKVEAFASGQTAMIVSATPHVNVISERGMTDFQVGAVPVADDFSGTPGATYGSWGIGIADSSDHKEEAWRFVEFLLGQEGNAELATAANMFPANPDATLDEDSMDEHSAAAFAAWQESTPVDEFLGLPAAEQLQRTLIEQTQQILAGDVDAATGLANAQAEWDGIIGD